MRILVDADACPVKKEIIKIAKEFELDVLMYFDTSHEYSDGYSEVYIVDKGNDSVDLALINKTKPKDVVVSQDYGVAALALAKGCFVLDQFGFVFTEFNIDAKLNQRAHSQKLRKSGVRTKGPKKRKSADNDKFSKSLRELIQSINNTKVNYERGI